MLTLSQALRERFPDGQEWVRDVVDAIDEVSLDSEVHDVAQGWMRVGEADSRLVDALFVLTEEGLGFGQPASGSAERWVPLVAITAIDAIEGTGHPLEAIEIHLSGGMAMLVGLPEPFVEVLVTVLMRQVATSAEPEQATMPRDLDEAAEVDASTLDGLPPSPWVETDVHTGPWAPMPDVWAPPTAEAASDAESMELPPTPFALDTPTFLPPPDSAAPEVVIDSVGFTEPAEPAGAAAPAQPSDRFDRFDRNAAVDAYRFDPTVPFDAPDPSEVDTADTEFADTEFADTEFADTEFADTEFAEPDPVEDFFAADEHGGAALRGAMSTDPHDALRAIQFPEPFKGVSYLGGHPDHPRKRKNSVLVFSSAGVAMTGGGMGGGQFAIPWAQVRSLDVQGADEVKFTHNHRIDLNSSAVIVELRSSDVLVFEVKLRRPATMRSTLAPILSMVRSLR